MKHQDFNELVDYIVEQRIKKVMCKKSAEYARGNDKLYNFKRSAEIDGITPVEALRGMDLKHRTSISDMVFDLANPDKEYHRKIWEEKLTDHINYMFLLWALLAEQYGWEIDHEIGEK